MDRPILSLGVLGFSPATAALIYDVVRSLDATWRPTWRASDGADADGYLLSPDLFVIWQVQASVQQASDGASFGALPLHVSLDLATSAGKSSAVSAAALAPASVSASGSAQSGAASVMPGLAGVVLAAMLRLELSLRSDISAYRVAAQIFRRYRLGLPMQGHCLLETGPRCVAGMDFDRMELSIDATATADEVANSVWYSIAPELQSRSSGRFQVANALPMRMLDAMWLFALHCPEGLLPVRYRFAQYALRAVPDVGVHRLPARLLKLLLALRGAQTASFKDLMAATQLTPLALGNALAALCFAGSLEVHWRAASGEAAPGFRDSVPSSRDSTRTGEQLRAGTARQTAVLQELRSWVA